MNISEQARMLPASAIRKMVPLADAAKAQGVKVYHLNVGAPDIKSPECALNAVRENSLDHISYSNSAGLIELRKGLVEKYYKHIGIDIKVEDLLVTVAGSEAVDMALKICCNPGDEVIVTEPFYTNYNTFAFMHGIVFKAVKTDIKSSFKADIAGFESLISPKTKAILISNPCNPTGSIYTKEEVLAIGKFAKEHNLFFISDEVYREFCYSDEPIFSVMNVPGLEENAVLVDSVSKRYNLCGCRIGCIISRNKDVMAAALKYGQARLCPPIYGQIAAIAALDTPDSYFEAVKKEYIARRDVAVEMLNRIPGVFSPKPLGAFYTIADLPVEDASDFARWMLTEYRKDGATVMVTPASSFYSTPGRGKNQVRIAYVLEIPELRKAMDILASGLAEYNETKR